MRAIYGSVGLYKALVALGITLEADKTTPLKHAWMYVNFL